MERVKLELNLDNQLYAPGDHVTGTVRLHAPYDVPADRLTAHFSGKATVWFQEYEKTQTYTASKEMADEELVLWRFVPAGQLLENSAEENSAVIPTPCVYRFRFLVPHSAATSFSYPSSPGHVRYFVKASLSLFGDVLYTAEQQVSIVAPNRVLRSVASRPKNHQKTFSFNKGRSVEVECRLEKAYFTSVEKVPMEIRIQNRWKQSLKYVHINVVRRLDCQGAHEKYEEVTLKKVYNHDCTGVGLPAHLTKIPVNDSVTFRPDLNLPALTPNFAVDDIMRLEYFIKIAIGRAHNFVIAEMMIPIQIVSEVVDKDLNANEDSVSDKENVDLDAPLIDFSTPTNHYNPFLSPLATVDLLA
ncbi:unnamed protein product, partial [Mesorhabditis spiculigera]